MLSRKRKKNLATQDVNITSLMDVLTVLLFFLIKIFTINSMNITLPPDIVLADSKVKRTFEESLTIGIGPKRIIIDNQTFVTLNNGRFLENDIMEDGRSIKKLFIYLKKEIAKREKVFTNEKGESIKMPPGKLLIEVHKNLRFSTLKYLLHTATVAGYGDFQFLIQGE